MTMSTTTNVLTSHSRRPRSLSLALIASSNSPLATLPIEVVLRIFELALLTVKPSNLAILSRFIQPVVNAILYRSVVLQNEKELSLFHRTITTRKSAYLAQYVKALAVTWTPPFHHPGQPNLVSEIALACTRARVLALPNLVKATLVPGSASSFGLVSNFTRTQEHGELIHLTIERMTSDPDIIRSLYRNPTSPIPPTDYSKFALITHLRICEPSEGWCSPIRILESFGPLPHLTHLQLARRADANEANDEIFMQEVKAILATRQQLKMLVVSVFAPGWRDRTAVFTSNMWSMLQDVANEDARVYQHIGSWEEWKSDWKSLSVLDPIPIGFWESVKEAGKVFTPVESDIDHDSDV
ncbi:hypothetical protein AX16_003991 [Volvariella volvacea WC 439]|nr:hypothetical protein AX16_003991 [Volvariella volvacea WC 439]